VEDVRLALTDKSFANCVQESIDTLDVILEEALSNFDTPKENDTPPRYQKEVVSKFTGPMRVHSSPEKYLNLMLKLENIQSSMMMVTKKIS